MDPDRFQMKDLKRRLAALEKAHKKLNVGHQRLREKVRSHQTRIDWWIPVYEPADPARPTKRD